VPPRCRSRFYGGSFSLMHSISPDARHHSSQGNGLRKDTVPDPRLQPSRGCHIHVTPDDLHDLQRETTQVEQRRIWPWHYQEVYVTGIDRVTAGNRTEHTHLAQATARRRREDLTPNRVERVKIWSLLVLWLC
jgi:hypothetical protein